MRYFMECPYCGAQYTEEGQKKKERFVCKSCGAENRKEHILKKEKTLNDNRKEKNEETDGLDSIKQFETEKYRVSDNGYSNFKTYMQRRAAVRLTVSLVALLICAIGFIIKSESSQRGEGLFHALFSEEAQLKREEKKGVEASEEYAQCREALDGLLHSLEQKDIESAQSYLAFELSDFFGLVELEEAIHSCFMNRYWGTEATYNYMEYISGTETKDNLVFDIVFSNGANAKITFEKCEDGQMRIVPDFMLVQNTVVRCDCYSDTTPDEATLLVEGEEIDLEPDICENKYGSDQAVYTIPVLIKDRYKFTIAIEGSWTYIGEEQVSDNNEDIYLYEKVNIYK